MDQVFYAIRMGEATREFIDLWALQVEKLTAAVVALEGCAHGCDGDMCPHAKRYQRIMDDLTEKVG